MPAISVLMPVYNAAPFLKEAVDSILNQTFNDFEFLIFNDGSTDNSKEILSSYTDPRISLIDFDKNQGYVRLLNLGLEMATGKYIARMDADDVSVDSRFEKQYNFLEQNPEYILCGSAFAIIDTGRKIDLPTQNDEIKLKMLTITPFCHPSVLIRTEALARNKMRYDERYAPAEDIEMWVQLSDFGKFHNFEEILLLYRLHDNNISFRKRTPEQEYFFRQTQKKYISKFFVDAGLTNEEEDKLYDLLLGNHLDYHTLLKIRDVLQKIIAGNFNYTVETKEVHSFLEQFFFNRCTTSTHLGMKVFFLQNLVSFNKIPMIMNLKFLVKSLIRYQG